MPVRTVKLEKKSFFLIKRNEEATIEQPLCRNLFRIVFNAMNGKPAKPGWQWVVPTVFWNSQGSMKRNPREATNHDFIEFLRSCRFPEAYFKRHWVSENSGLFFAVLRLPANGVVFVLHRRVRG